MKNPSPLARRWPCVFPHPSSTIADPQVDKLWRAAFGKRAPFGDLRNQFRRQHCKTINPYGSERCPYAQSDCAAAFLACVEKTVAARPKVPVGYFIKVARSEGARRADEKPPTREGTKVLTAPVESARVGTDVSTTETEEGRSRLADTGQAADGKGQGLHSPSSGPISIGDLLGSLDIRPRERADHEGEEGAK